MYKTAGKETKFNNGGCKTRKIGPIHLYFKISFHPLSFKSQGTRHVSFHSRSIKTISVTKLSKKLQTPIHVFYKSSNPICMQPNF